VCSDDVLRCSTHTGFSTFAHLAGVDAEDPNTVGHRYDGTAFELPGIDSINMYVSEQSSWPSTVTVTTSQLPSVC